MSEQWQSVLPMKIVDDQDRVIEEIICGSISGGANYVEGMPKQLSLWRIKDGIAIQAAEYEFKELIVIPESKKKD